MDELEFWENSFLQRKKSCVTVTEHIEVFFKPDNEFTTFKLSVTNDGMQEVEIEEVKISSDNISIQNKNDIDWIICSGGRLNLIFNVKREKTNKVQTLEQIQLCFFNFSVHRTILIVYKPNVYIRKNATHIRREYYDLPDDLLEIIGSNKTEIERVEALNEVILPYNQLNFKNYAEYFHNLLYLEEIGLLWSFRIYQRRRAYFTKIRNKYELQMDDLFETRPSLKIGDIVAACKNKDDRIVYEGIIFELTDDAVLIKFGQNFEKTFNDSTYESYTVKFFFARSPYIRQHRAIDLATKIFDEEFLFPTQLMECTPQMDIHLNENFKLELNNGQIIPWFNNSLNKYQRMAVMQVLRGECRNPHIIWGPPGTGKTTTLTEIALQLHSNPNARILLATQTNSAADLIARRLINAGSLSTSKIVRLTSINYARQRTIDDELLDYCVAIKYTDDSSKHEDDPYADSDHSLKIQTENNIDFLENYRLVVGTNLAFSSLVESKRMNFSFTHVILDEASQCTEIEAMIPILLLEKGGQLTMAGDPNQMSPLLFDEYARERGLKISLLKRLLDSYSEIEFDVTKTNQFDPRLITKLHYNYRSLPSILDFVSNQFYDSQLTPMLSSVMSNEAKILQLLSKDGIIPPNDCNHGIYFFNVQGRCKQLGTTSWCNSSETKAIQSMVIKLLGFNIDEKDIGIISPYSLQVRQIKYAMHDLMDLHAITVGTVEKFQGQERLIILLSTVRTDQSKAKTDVKRRLGFVQCPRRLNVAVSRARALFIVFGRASLLSMDNKWEMLIEECKDKGTYIEYEN